MNRQSAESKDTPNLMNEDYWRLRIVSEARLSPDGTRVAYTVNWLDEDTDATRSAIWLLDVATGMGEKFTQGKSHRQGSIPVSGMSGGSALSGGDSQPRWSPDGERIAFVSASAGGPPQIYVQEVAAGGAPRCLTWSPGGAFFPAWSPDGTKIAYISSEPTSDHLVPIETEWLRTHPHAPQNGPRLRRVTRLRTRLEGRGFIESYTHVCVTGVGGGQSVQLTEGAFDDGAPAWSPDGKEIVFSSTRGIDPEQALTSLCSLDAETREIRVVNTTPMSQIDAPVFSPDEKMIAYYGSIDNAERRYLQGQHLWVVSRQGHDERNLSAELDRQSGQTFHEHYGLIPLQPPSWSADGSQLYFHAADHGDEAIFAVSPDGGASRRVSTGHGQTFGPQITPDGETIVCIASTPTRPFEVSSVPAAGGDLTPISNTNPWLKGMKLVEPEYVPFKGADGLDIEGWLIKPSGDIRDESYPLILHVHGGPYLGWANTFYFQYQALAASGFASLYINPRGSAGYGQAFTQLRDYGENDYQDLMLGLDAVLAQGEADPKRLGVTGLSYGGFMTNWIIGHTNRFAAALTVNGLASWVTMQGASDIGGYWPGLEWGGNYWESEEMWDVFRSRSPITFVQNIQTPLMLFGAEQDYRVPIEQEELMLTALRVQGKVVEMIRFPDANHIIATSAAPRHRVAQWQLVQAWFERWLN